MISRSKDRKIPLGIFGKPFGLKGFIFLRYYGGNPENIKEFKDLFVKEYVYPMIRGHAIYEGVYLLGTSIARPLIAKRQIAIAKKK